MFTPEIKRARLESCVAAIIDVHKSLDPEELLPEMFAKIQVLKLALEDLCMDRVSERDIERVEAATNAVLTELGQLFPESGERGLSGLGVRH